VKNPFSLLSVPTKIYSWLSYTRWLVGAIIPFAFYFKGKVIVLASFALLSLIVFILAIMSNKDRESFPGICILISELSAFLWMFASFLLALDTN